MVEVPLETSLEKCLFILPLWLAFGIAEAVMFVLSFTCKSEQSALIHATVLYFLSSIFMGSQIKPDMLPDVLYQLHFLDPFKYIFTMLMIVCSKDEQFGVLAGDSLLETYGIDQPYWKYLLPALGAWV